MSELNPLIVDLFAGDGITNLAALAAAGWPWGGVLLKATQGVYYPTQPKTREWFLKMWPHAQEVGGVMFGKRWFRSAYHYHDFNHPNDEAQAEFFLKFIEDAGGAAAGDFPYVLDVEGSGNPTKPGKARIEDGCSKFAEVIERETGRKPILYGNIYLWENGVDFNNTGCQSLIVARYTSTLPANVYQRIHCPYEKLWGWQYAGTGPETPVPFNYPDITPLSSTKKLDITAMTIYGSGPQALDQLASHNYAEDPAHPFG
jgi:GH25 family lysozyme M1 (1,4-beta-N-acetylmuramidase)